MNYKPQVNDFVLWDNGKGVEGWIYFVDEEYITIEFNVRPKSKENYYACTIHQNERILIVCYKEDWSQLKYIKSRKSIYEEEENPMALVGTGSR